MVGWHHQLDQYEFEQAPGDDEGQGSLARCNPWGSKKSDTTDFCLEKALVIANTLVQQSKRQFYTWTSSDSQYQNKIDYIIFSQRLTVLYSQQKQDWELTVTQIMNSSLPNSDLNWRK